MSPTKEFGNLIKNITSGLQIRLGENPTNFNTNIKPRYHPLLVVCVGISDCAFLETITKLALNYKLEELARV